jgi:polysaccharide pyruvyl transferase WcaK-like protein
MGATDDVRVNWLMTTLEKSLAALRQIDSDILPVLIPHDFRSNWNDVALGNRLVSHCGWKSDEYVLLDDKVSAAAVKAICARLDILISGRMHCGIAALGQGIPVALFDYQGKVKGLLDYFGLDSAIPFQADAAVQAKVLLDKTVPLLQQRDIYAAKVRKSLPSVMELSAKNVR